MKFRAAFRRYICHKSKIKGDDSHYKSFSMDVLAYSRRMLEEERGIQIINIRIGYNLKEFTYQTVALDPIFPFDH